MDVREKLIDLKLCPFCGGVIECIDLNKNGGKGRMATWIKSGDTMIGYQIIPEREKPVFGIMKGNQFVVYGQFHDKQSAEQFMESLKISFNIKEA